MEPDKGPRVPCGFYFESFVPVRLYTLLSLPLWLLLCFSPASNSVRIISSLCAGSHLVGLHLSLSSRPSSSSSSSLVFYFNLSVFFCAFPFPFYCQCFFTGHISYGSSACADTPPSLFVCLLSSRTKAALPHITTAQTSHSSRGTYVAENNNKSDRRKNNYMTDNLSPFTNSTSPRQTELAETCLLHCCEPRVGLKWHLRKPAVRRAERHVHSRAREDNICIIHALSDPCALLNSIIYTLFPPWLSPLKKKKRESAGSSGL